MNTQVFGQTNATDQTNASYVVELMKKNKTEIIFIVGNNMHREYSKEWLTYSSNEGEWIIFTRGDKEHRWNIKNTIFIEKYGKIIKVRLNENIGE
ncbi:MAG: hypothetical protein GY932_02945 [Arcobacter sp.]|nr:hypothetical protein [Arcobacter sp.]